MKTRMTLAASALALGLCLVAAVGCGSAKRTQQQKADEEKASAETKAAQLKADLAKLDGVWQRTAVKVNDGKSDVIPTLEIDLDDELLGRVMTVSGDQLGGEPMQNIAKKAEFLLKQDADGAYLVWAGASPEVKVEYEFDGDKLKLKCDKAVDVVGLAGDFDLTGEWTRKPQ